MEISDIDKEYEYHYGMLINVYCIKIYSTW
jgi:hypothetical protein